MYQEMGVWHKQLDESEADQEEQQNFEVYPIFTSHP